MAKEPWPTDIALGAATWVGGYAVGSARALTQVLAGSASVLRLPSVLRQTGAARLLDELGRRGREEREVLAGAADRLSRALVPAALDVALDRVDLTRLVADRVDLNALAAHIDADAIARRLDLIGHTRYVINGIDLPEIIRESTGSVTTDAVLGLRMQGIEVDQAIAGVRDRILRRRGKPVPAARSAAVPPAT